PGSAWPPSSPLVQRRLSHGANLRQRAARSLVAALLGGAWLSLAAAAAPTPAPTSAATPAAAPTVTPAIAGVVSQGTPIETIKEGLQAVEGPLRHTDGSLLFTNNQTGQILRAAADGSVTTWFEAPLGANALTRTPKGELVATLQKTLAIGVLQPGAAPRLLAEGHEGKPFNRPNDLVADGRGNIYFTDTVPL